jgi:tetratricopeptide (TPR) repeat protein
MTHPPDNQRLPSDRALAAYDAQRSRGDSPHRALLDGLAGQPEPTWLECAQALMLRGDSVASAAVLGGALTEHPGSAELRLALAGALRQNGDSAQAESLLRDLLAAAPDHAAATLLLARILKEQGRMHAAATVVRALFRHPRHDPELVIRAVELLDDCERKEDAAALCEHEIAAGSTDPRLHAYAGMLLAQLGQFELARTRHEFVLANSAQALDWHMPLGLADLQRYADRSHPDFVRFHDYLQHASLAWQARSSLLFALGKAHDDIGDYAQASRYLREANALVHASISWSGKLWRRSIEARLSRRLPSGQLDAPADWTPIFIVGAPRSGTTLLAELLGRNPQVCHRGEVAWLPTLAGQVLDGHGDYPGRLVRAASTYAAQLRQDDSDARWFIDKQPHNFMHVDLILAMFPNARIIHCQRNARDNALSLWMKSFQTGTQDFSYDFTDIGTVIRGSRRLMKHWTERFPASVRTVRYEQLASDPEGCLTNLSEWLQLPAHDLLGTGPGDRPISTASLWQARQPVHTRSVQRWRHYAPYVPELLQLPED